MASSEFLSLGLSEWLAIQCKELGLRKPTPVQSACIPSILSGRDCLACAKTGSGKTAAFALPIIQKFSEDPHGMFALILTPTRELAYQISEQFEVMGKPIGLRVVTITGGIDSVQQGIDVAEQPHIMISTPGRLADHLEHTDTFNLRRIRFLVMDEADRLLEDGFGEQLETIMSHLPKKRQTLLFSATLTDSLKQLEESAETTPFIWQESSTVATVDELDQRYVLVPADMKDAYLFHLLDNLRDECPNSSIVVFTNTCKYCQLLALMCHDLGFKCMCIHSALRQRQRLASLARFKSNQIRLLIATDVASRGLDIPTVDFIINHNVPHRSKDYIHRVGRTARAGRNGAAITFVTQFDIGLIHAVEERINMKLKEHKLDDNEVVKIATEVAVARREAEITLDEQDFGENREINKRKRLILEGKDPDEEMKRSKRKRWKFIAEKKKEKKRKRNNVVVGSS